MTANEQRVVKDGLSALRRVRNDLQNQLMAIKRLSNYYEMRYHDTRDQLGTAWVNIRELEDMVGTLREQLGDKDPDLKLGDDFDVV